MNPDNAFLVGPNDVRYDHLPSPEEIYEYLCTALITSGSHPYLANSRIRYFLKVCCGIPGAREILSVHDDGKDMIALHVRAYADESNDGQTHDYYVAIWCRQPSDLDGDEFDKALDCVPKENRIRVIITMKELGLYPFQNHSRFMKYGNKRQIGPDILDRVCARYPLAGVEQSFFEGCLAWTSEQLQKEWNSCWFASSLEIDQFVITRIDSLLSRLRLKGMDSGLFKAHSRLIDHATSAIMVEIPCELRVKSAFDEAEMDTLLTLEFCLSANATPVIPYVYLTPMRDDFENGWYPGMEMERIRLTAKEMFDGKNWIRSVTEEETFDDGAIGIATPYEFPIRPKDDEQKSEFLVWLVTLIIRLYITFNPSLGLKEGVFKA
ncbi:MAG: hypothetical protein J6O18_04940 [Bacilli bacterium]|nr:hypothetical protein [Bacilli bacterium]